MKKLFRKKRTWVLLTLALLLFLWWFGTFTLTTTKVTLTSGKVKNDITIVQLTDLHGARFGPDNAALIRLIEKQEPDLIACTGDMASAGDEKGRQTALSLLSRLAEDYPAYFVNGEHDHTPAFLDSLREAGVHVLDYTTETVTVGDTTLRLYGATSLYYSPTYDLTNEFTLDEEHYTILLAHIPNREKFAAFGTDLALCGDTHGGQVRLPFIGPVYHQGAWFPRLLSDGAPLDDKGLFTEGDFRLFISSGLGNFPIPLRICNRPEIAVIRLEPAA